jgi:hypothetical protein
VNDVHEDVKRGRRACRIDLDEVERALDLLPDA